MNDSGTILTPDKLILATDLSARCDRALDRARQLARQWSAGLLVVHAVEPAEQIEHWYVEHHLTAQPRAINPLGVATRRLRRSLGEDLGGIQVSVAEGESTEVVAKATQQTGAKLIITGLARDETLGRLYIGHTVENLIRASRVPVLMVRDRPMGPYRRIVVATDLKEGSQQVLRTAMDWFSDQRLDLLHAYDAPFAGLTMNRDSYATDYRAVVERDLADFLASARIAAETLNLVLQPGAVAPVLASYVEARDIDLVVIGGGEKSLLRRLIGGDSDTTILAEVPCDILVVPKGDVS